MLKYKNQHYYDLSVTKIYGKVRSNIINKEGKWNKTLHCSGSRIQKNEEKRIKMAKKRRVLVHLNKFN